MDMDSELLAERLVDQTELSLTPAGAEYIQGVRRQLRQRMRVLLEELGEADAKEYLRITERMLSITQRMAQKR